VAKIPEAFTEKLKESNLLFHVNSGEGDFQNFLDVQI
jgi:hypothetical protein